MNKLFYFLILILIFSSQYTYAKSKSKGLKSEIDVVELQKSAEDGLPMAQCLLGLAYKLGNYNLVADETKGIAWITKAAVQGYITAQECLADYYRDEKIDYKESWYWALKAAQQGSSEAMRILAGYAIQGHQCEKDLAEGIKWLLLSASSGDLASHEWLSELDYKLNIYQTRHFFNGYNLAQRWLEIHSSTGINMEQKYKEKFEQFCKNER